MANQLPWSKLPWAEIYGLFLSPSDLHPLMCASRELRILVSSNIVVLPVKNPFPLAKFPRLAQPSKIKFKVKVDQATDWLHAMGASGSHRLDSVKHVDIDVDPLMDGGMVALPNMLRALSRIIPDLEGLGFVIVGEP